MAPSTLEYGTGANNVQENDVIQALTQMTPKNCKHVGKDKDQMKSLWPGRKIQLKVTQ